MWSRKILYFGVGIETVLRNMRWRGWVGHTTCMGDEKCVQNLFRKSEGLDVDGKIILIWITNRAGSE